MVLDSFPCRFLTTWTNRRVFGSYISIYKLILISPKTKSAASYFFLRCDGWGECQTVGFETGLAKNPLANSTIGTKKVGSFFVLSQSGRNVLVVFW